MEIKDVQANTGKIDVVAHVVSKDDERTFNKNGNEGRVCSAILKDASGEIKITLWNDDIDAVKVGDKVHIQNGWCSEYKGEKQLSSGKFGKIEVLESGQAGVLTNDAELIQKQEAVAQIQEAGMDPSELQAKPQEDDEIERIEDEEEVIFG